MEARPSTHADLRLVSRSLSARSLDELAAAGLPLRRAVDALKAPIKAGTAATLTHKGEAVALITWEHIPYDEASAVLATAFMATERFFAPDVPSVRFGRRFLREIQADAGNLPIVSYSWSSHPKTERWYRLIGYERREVDGSRKAFILGPR